MKILAKRNGYRVTCHERPKIMSTRGGTKGSAASSREVWSWVESHPRCQALVLFGYSLEQALQALTESKLSQAPKFTISSTQLGDEINGLVAASYRANNWWNRDRNPKLVMERFFDQQDCAVAFIFEDTNLDSAKKSMRESLAANRFHRSIHATDCSHEAFDVIAFLLWLDVSTADSLRGLSEDFLIIDDQSVARHDCEIEHRSAVLFDEELPAHHCERSEALLSAKNYLHCVKPDLHEGAREHVKKPRIVGEFFRALLGRLAFKFATKLSPSLTDRLRKFAISHS